MVWNVKEEQTRNLSTVLGLYFCILSFQPLDKVAMLINKQYKILFKEFAWRKRVYIAVEKTSFVLINQHGPGWYQLQTGQRLRPMTIIVGYLLTKFNSSVTLISSQLVCFLPVGILILVGHNENYWFTGNYCPTPISQTWHHFSSTVPN